MNKLFYAIVVVVGSLLAIDAAEAKVLQVCLPVGACPFASIQAAIDIAADGDVIAIGKGTYGESLQITDKALTLKGEGPKQTMIIGAGGRVITLACSSPRPLILRSVTISGGGLGPGHAGAGIQNEGCNVDASDLVIDGNAACHHGCAGIGGIHNSTGQFKLSASVVSNNAGGGIGNHAEMFIKDTTVVSNSSSRIDAVAGIGNSGSLTIRDSVITSNNASKGPGGVYNNGTMKITDSVISSNSSGARNCAGILLAGGNTTIVGSTIKANATSGTEGRLWSGGGLCVSPGAAVTVKDSTIKENQATKTGGGVYASGGSLTLISSNIVRNEAYYHADPSIPGDVDVPGNGGGIYTEEGAAIQMRNATVRHNTPNDCAGAVGC